MTLLPARNRYDGSAGGDRRTALDRHVDGRELSRIGDREDHAVLVARLGDNRAVGRQQGLTGHDAIALDGMGGKALAL